MHLSQVSLSRLLNRLKKKNLSLGFGTWKTTILHMKEQNNLGLYLLHQSAIKLKHKSFNAWLVNANHKSKLKLIFSGLTINCVKRRVRNAFNQWIRCNAIIQKENKKRCLVVRLLQRKAKANLSNVFKYWNYGAKMETEREEISAHLVRQWTSLNVAKHFRAWHVYHCRLMEVKRNGTMAVAFYQRILQSKCVRTWRRGSKKRRFLKNIIKRRVSTWKYRHMSFAVQVWKRYVVKMEGCDIQEDIKQNCIRNIISRMQNRKCAKIVIVFWV